MKEKVKREIKKVENMRERERDTEPEIWLKSKWE